MWLVSVAFQASRNFPGIKSILPSVLRAPYKEHLQSRCLELTNGYGRRCVVRNSIVYHFIAPTLVQRFQRMVWGFYKYLLRLVYGEELVLTAIEVEVRSAQVP